MEELKLRVRGLSKMTKTSRYIKWSSLTMQS